MIAQWIAAERPRWPAGTARKMRRSFLLCAVITAGVGLGLGYR